MRVTDAIARLVPNVAAFPRVPALREGVGETAGRVTLNVLGYLGGVAWAILTAARVSVVPDGAPGLLVQKFFKFYAMWSPPLPITLCEVQCNSDVRFPVWNQATNGADLFPVLTPAFPCMNTCFNVLPATLEVLMSEFKRGQAICASMSTCVSEAGRADRLSTFAALIEI